MRKFRLIKSDFHMIARIPGDARIAQICHQRSLHRNENCLVLFARDRFVASDPCVLDREFSISAIAAFLALKEAK